MDFDIIYESLDAKTRRRIDAKFAQKEEDRINQRKLDRKKDSENGYKCFFFGMLVIVISLIIGGISLVFLPEIFLVISTIMIMFGILTTMMGCCGILNCKF